MKGNELGDEGVKALCDALKGHKGGPSRRTAGSLARGWRCQACPASPRP